MEKKFRLLFLLALLMTAATGAWAQDAKHLITATYREQTRSLEQPLPYATTIGELYEAVSGQSFSDLISSMSSVGMPLTGITSRNTSVVSIGELNGASTPVTVNADGETIINLIFGSYVQGIFVSAISPLYAYMKDGVKDADKWTASTDGTNFGALPIGGLKGDGSETVTLKYTGRLKVKGVKATSDAAPAAAAFAADEYNEASWDDTNKKVVFEKKKATTTPVAVADATTDVTWGDEWYTVSGNVTITGTVTLGADTHLILQDGAKLTINGQLDAYTNRKNLYIYGQRKGDGKLNVICSSDDAINSSAVNRIDIHGGEITAVSTNLRAFVTGILNVYSGKLTATSDGDNGTIQFCSSFDVYGGEVEGTSNATSSDSPSRGISDGGYDKTLTVYGGKVTATGNGREGYGDYGSGINCYVKSGTSGIKFYFSDNGTDWDEGTSYASATSVGGSNDAVATKKRYVKAE